MNTQRSCPRCGAPIPEETPPGGCPRCLLEAGLDEPTETGREGEREPAPTVEELAEHFPELTVERLVGQGGMGFVYEARQNRLERAVALKILAPRFSESPEFAERFSREARAMARLSHPNIVTVHDFGDRSGLYFFLMEFVEGANLRELIRNGKLEPEEALAIVPHICDALQYAHDQGVVHRDIKPENVLIDHDGGVKITDFGLAKLAGRPTNDLTLTMDGTVVGTPQYMAPEQLERPQSVDHRADIYSLGVVFYELLTGELPIGRFAPPSKKVAVHVSLDEVVLKALEKEPELRYQHVVEVKTEVDDYVGASPGGGHGESGGASRHGDSPRDTGANAPRTSALAKWGVGLEAFALAIWLLVISLFGLFMLTGGNAGTELAPPMRISLVELLIPTLLSALASACLLVGMGLSIAAWIVIARSDGRLVGRRLAVIGTFAPVGLWILGQLFGAALLSFRFVG